MEEKKSKSKNRRVEIRLSDDELNMLRQINEKSGMTQTQILTIGLKKVHKLFCGE